MDHVILTAPGDKILLYSDGLIENQAAQKAAAGGKMWLTNTLRIIDERQHDPLRHIIWDAYLKRIGDVEPLDDVTIVTIDLKNLKLQHDQSLHTVQDLSKKSDIS